MTIEEIRSGIESRGTGSFSSTYQVNICHVSYDCVIGNSSSYF